MAEWPAPGEVRDAHTGRWRGVTAAALAAAALGVVAGRPGLLLLGAVGGVVGVYASTARPPDATLALDRDISGAPAPGETVGVTVTVRNAGDDPVPELRLYDGVPDGARVVDGPARLATALDPGGAATLRYRVRLPPGECRFRPALAVLRDGSGAAERALRVGEPTAVAAEPSFDPVAAVPVAPGRGVGAHPAAVGGDGVAFHSVREYRRGDPAGRIDWPRKARTGDLATLEFREHRAATVVVVVDARPPARRAPVPDAATAFQRSVEGASRVLASLAGRTDRTGLAVLGGETWVPPGAGAAHRARLRRALSTAGEAAAGEADPAALATRLPAGARVVLFTPLCDEVAAESARRLDAAAPVAVVAPDPTGSGTAGRDLATLERRHRVGDLRASGVPVVDWPSGASLDRVLAAAEAGR